ncbi:ATP-dependent RNA helicase DbpA [Agarivorans aestuarii]|uniref:ATP-dependent RNA helicase DbpA n=1 Tax=Agarivorans aestuarii TaxID=1563703 RepID=A0ABU7G967_9ALTE|nr:ATP-dependent RNA helicase DbpA [Agarivorans aestuarii]MEE1674995.1 ATP-dependent RNA helicase DbpA [Agarivorans aestuarii]
MSQTDFSTLDLHPDLLKNLETLGYSSMTPIQAQSLPLILAGKDVIAQGKTGSGKTAAFGLGLLNALEVKRFRIQTLVLCPTRELADQVAKEIRKLARSIHNIKVLTLCGGMPFGPQIGSLEHGAHIVVGTPGRIEEHLRKGTLRLDNVKNLILDEADRMLEMGFQSAIDAIIDLAPKQRQTLLFSATFPEQIESIANNIMQQPVRVEVASTHDNSSISQHFFKVDDNEQRMLALRLLLLQHRPKSSVVFCNTKREAQEVAGELSLLGFSALALHGDLEQRERDQTLVQFANNSAAILVATDVAARGLDIDSLDAVFNYHLARDTEVHVHRIGRTGRAGGKGIACSFFSDKEHYKVALLEDYLGRSINDEELPSMALLNKKPAAPLMATLQIDGGKKQKVRAGDILGALTGENGISGSQVGKINLFDNRAYVAVERDALKHARKKLEHGKMKGRSFRVRHLPC